jgi:hypothetical protein
MWISWLRGLKQSHKGNSDLERKGGRGVRPWARQLIECTVRERTKTTEMSHKFLSHYNKIPTIGAETRFVLVHNFQELEKEMCAKYKNCFYDDFFRKIHEKQYKIKHFRSIKAFPNHFRKNYFCLKIKLLQVKPYFSLQ